MLTVEDEYTREGVAVVVGRHMPDKRVQETLVKLFRVRGAPECLSRGNGPQLVERELPNTKMVSKTGGVKTYHIDPGSPWQNARIRGELQCDPRPGVSEPGAVPKCAGGADQDARSCSSGSTTDSVLTVPWDI